VKLHHGPGIEYVMWEIFLNYDYEFFTGRDCILLDVGMNFGATTLHYANKPNVRHVYAFEPFIPTYEEALRNIQLNGRLAPKIFTYAIGLGQEDRTLEILYDKDVSGGMSTTVDRFREPGSIFKKEKATLEKVAVKNAFTVLDPIVSQHDQDQIILKIDTEGAEFEILETLDEGGLLRKIDVVMLEYHFRSPQELEDRLTTNGFVVFYKGEHKKGEQTGRIHGVRNR
jgi:FkbM family methyltransferase